LPVLTGFTQGFRRVYPASGRPVRLLQPDIGGAQIVEHLPFLVVVADFPQARQRVLVMVDGLVEPLQPGAGHAEIGMDVPFPVQTIQDSATYIG
jgi:hypothetical protein